MAGENVGLDLASQTGQNNIALQIAALVTALGNIKGDKGDKGDPGDFPTPENDGNYMLSVSSGVASWTQVVDGDGGSY